MSIIFKRLPTQQCSQTRDEIQVLLVKLDLKKSVIFSSFKFFSRFQNRLLKKFQKLVELNEVGYLVVKASNNNCDEL